MDGHESAGPSSGGARLLGGDTVIKIAIAENVAESGLGVLVFSREMDGDSLARRMLGGKAALDQYRASRNLLTKNERSAAKDRLAIAKNALLPLPLYVEDEPIYEVRDIRFHARRQLRQHDIKLIVIDYLQLLTDRESARLNRQLETAAISRELKGMARELKVPVIAVSQLSRAPEKNGDKDEVPKLSDLRDSGAIEQDADVVIFLTRPAMIKGLKEQPELKDRVYLHIAKHRNGELGKIPMRFNGPFNRFEDYSDDEYRKIQDEKKVSAGNLLEPDPDETDEDLEGL